MLFPHLVSCSDFLNSSAFKSCLLWQSLTPAHKAPPRPLPSARHAGWIGRLDGTSASQRQYLSFVIEESSRASQQTHAYDELRRPRPLDIILTVVGMCSSGAHGEHCDEWQCVETYVL